MSEKQRLSYSAINSFSTCGEKYRLAYKVGYREKAISSSLIFGSAIDKALNTLLETKDLEKAKLSFNKEWHFQYINKVYTAKKI